VHHSTRSPLPFVFAAGALVAACGSDNKSPDALKLPGSSFFPYSINAGADDAIYVGSPATGEVVKFAAGGTTPTVFVSESTPAAGVNGILVDDADGVLYTCTNTFTSQTTVNAIVRSYDLHGNAMQTYPLPNQGGSVCEDMAFDANHNLYAADAWGGAIYVMGHSDTAFAPWTTDTLLKPTSPNAIPFGARGVLIQGSDMYVTNFNTGALVHIPIDQGGHAGTARAVTVTPALTNPESLRAIDAQHFVVPEDVWQSADGLVSKLTLSGDSATKTVIAEHLLGPSTLVVVGDNIWVPLGEVWHTLDGSPPDSLPFTVKRLTAQ
jgi:hypothetical protein